MGLNIKYKIIEETFATLDKANILKICHKKA
jgi:hypothetical protein